MKYEIHLNFLPLDNSLADFKVYRKKRPTGQEHRPREGVRSYSLPDHSKETEDWSSYWVSIDERPDFEKSQVSTKTNPYLTCWILFWALKKAAAEQLEFKQYRVFDKGFINEMSFIQREHEEGAEELIVQPYHLRSTGQFGYLVDFHFRLQVGVPFSRRIQQLSLSLDGKYRRNLDYYADRFTKIRESVQKFHNVFGAIRLPGSPNAIQVTKDFTTLPADRLSTKVYQFDRNHESKSQFTGLLNYGPLGGLENPPTLLFMFREEDRLAARRLAMSLRGSKSSDRFSFPGFNALFKCEPNISREPVVLPDLSQASIERALARTKCDMKNGDIIVPILVLPPEDNSYLIQKALFSHAKIATQVCTLRVLQDENLFKWSIANIALQVFCKAGGHPWKVHPTSGKSLIIGISQSHKLLEVDGRPSVSKYFAFSVMTDNSGLFQKIRVLGEGTEQKSYIGDLRRNLRDVLEQSAENFERIVIHTSFKLKHEEMDAIESTVNEISNNSDAPCRFAVVKVNQKSRFFAVNHGVNSLVPYESTRVRLGPREYLVWFEGIYPDKKTVNKVFPGPTHLQILRVSDKNGIPDEILLQDLVNLSGANWRGFNAKSAPVSVFYCHLVADLVHDFHERNLPLPPVEDIRPWFL